jgi:hypothetical protein
MNRNFSESDLRAVKLALQLAASDTGTVSRATLSRHFGGEAQRLMALEILTPDGHATTVATSEDDPTAVIWSSERSQFEQFSLEDGWVPLSHDELQTYSLEFRRLAEILVGELDLEPKGQFAEIRPGQLWDIGSCRLPRRAQRVSVWVARRLHIPEIWEDFVSAARERPPSRLRLVVALADTDQHPTKYLANHCIAAVSSLVSAINPFEIDGDVASTRMGQPSGEGRSVHLSADGGVLTVHGKEYAFRGLKHRAILRQLYEAWDRGEPRCLTEKVLLEAESGETVRRLSRAFKGHRNWFEVIKEDDGFCWLEV